MAIAPIKGSLKRAIIKDVSIGTLLGITVASLYWEFEHKRNRDKREKYYRDLEKKRQIEKSL